MGRTYRKEKVWGRKDSSKPIKRNNDEGVVDRRLVPVTNDEDYTYEEEYNPRDRNKDRNNF